MRVTRKKLRETFIPVNIELETQEEFDNMMSTLEPGVGMTLKDYCKNQGLNIIDLDRWNDDLWKKLHNMREDC